MRSREKEGRTKSELEPTVCVRETVSRSSVIVIRHVCSYVGCGEGHVEGFIVLNDVSGMFIRERQMV